MKLLKAITRLFSRKPREKSAYEIMSVTLYNSDGSFTPTDASLAGRCGYVRERLRDSGDSSPTSAEDKSQ
jgi:hypothetical protein